MENTKLVEFDIYCPTCIHKDIPEEEEPCTECLGVPARESSHKPEKYQKKE